MVRCDSTVYTRFGVWSETAPLAAEGAAPGNTVAHRTFGYSPLEPESTTLSFVADYAGETLAVDENTGNLYSGTFEPTVNWGDDNGEDNITARIVDLKGVYGSTRTWFQHDSQDVGTIFLFGIDIDGDTTPQSSAADATAPSVRFGYRASRARDGALAGGATISGKFVGNGHRSTALERSSPFGWSCAKIAFRKLSCLKI